MEQTIPLETAVLAPTIDSAGRSPPLIQRQGSTLKALSKFVHDLNNILAIVDMSMDRLTRNLN
jgi:hypothetical protein